MNKSPAQTVVVPNGPKPKPLSPRLVGKLLVWAFVDPSLSTSFNRYRSGDMISDARLRGPFVLSLRKGEIVLTEVRSGLTTTISALDPWPFEPETERVP